MAQEKTVLIIEDKKPLSEVISRKLESRGFAVMTARDVESSMKKLREESIDAIWLDHYLLGTDSGLDFLARVKDEDCDLSNVPVYVISIADDGERVQSYLQFGVDRFYAKSDYRLESIVDELAASIEEQSV